MDPVEDDSGTRKRTRDKREKIEWKGEAPGKGKTKESSHSNDRDAREEKRRKSRDDNKASERGDRDYDRDRDHRRSSAADTRVILLAFMSFLPSFSPEMHIIPFKKQHTRPYNRK